MRIVSFNVNGIRARLHQLKALIQIYSPDIIGLQETKVADESFPLKNINDLGYQTDFFGQKGHYGVALLTKSPSKSRGTLSPSVLKVTKGFSGDTDKDQKRWIYIEYAYKGKILHIANGYFPQGENRNHPEKFPNKRKFYQNTKEFVGGMPENANLVIMGDMNISHQNSDVGIGEKNKKRWLQTGKCSFLPEEREWLSNLIDSGLEDTFRLHYPDSKDQFSWFDYRSRGFEDNPKRGLRIDLILASRNIAAKCSAAGIALDIRAMEKPSDHSPVWADFELG